MHKSWLGELYNCALPSFRTQPTLPCLPGPGGEAVCVRHERIIAEHPAPRKLLKTVDDMRRGPKKTAPTPKRSPKRAQRP